MRLRFAYHEKPPLHIIGRTPLDKWPLDMAASWTIFQEVIADFQKDFDLTSHAFVLMNNHYHWLCTPNGKMDRELFNLFHEVINAYFCRFNRKSEFSKYALEPKPKIISTQSFPGYKETYRYVYNNPVRAGLVDHPLDYPFSTLRHVLGKPGLAFQVIDNMNLIIDPIETLRWIH